MNKAKFFDAVYPIMIPADVQTVELSYLLSKKFHQGQFRKSEFNSDGTPLRYFAHPRRSAYSLIQEAGVVDVDVICATLLHDVVEDPPETILVSRLLAACFSSKVAMYVRAVTKIPKVDSLNRFYAACEKNPEICLIKAADRLDNLRTLPVDKPDFCEKQKRETREIYLPYFAQKQNVLGAGFTNLVSQITNICK